MTKMAKKNLPPGLQKPMKPGRLTEIIRQKNPDLEINTYVHDRQSFFKEDRDRLANEGYFHLLGCSYNPGGTFFRDTPAVSVDVYGLPSEVWKKSSVTPEQLLQIVEKALLVENLWDCAWSISIAWSSRSSQLEWKFVSAARTPSEKRINGTVKVVPET